LRTYIIKIKCTNITERITPEDLNRFLLVDSDDENLEMISLEYKKYRLSAQDKKTKANKRSISKREIIHRNRLEGHRHIIRDYFSKTKHSHTSKMFRRRFRMNEDLFTSILNAVQENDAYCSKKRQKQLIPSTI
jgi:hypothetical protein